MSSWDAKFYKKQARLQEDAALRILKQVSFNGDERVLDIGCGDGKITKKIAEMVPKGEVIGIDPSKEMINEALADYSHIPNLSFFQEGAESFHFEKKFNLVTSFFALHWVKDHGLVLKNVKFALKKGGKIFFLMVSGGDPKIAEVFEREHWKPRVEKHFNEKFSMITEKDYHRLLDHYGFEKICVKLIGLLYQFATIKELEHYFMTWLPYATGLPHAVCRQFAAEIAENICLHEKKRTNIDLNTSLLFVEALKR